MKGYKKAESQVEQFISFRSRKLILYNSKINSLLVMRKYDELFDTFSTLNTKEFNCSTQLKDIDLSNNYYKL